MRSFIGLPQATQDMLPFAADAPPPVVTGIGAVLVSAGRCAALNERGTDDFAWGFLTCAGTP